MDITIMEVEMFNINDRFQIKTPSGWGDFKGIQKITKPTYNHIIFKDGGELKVSENHTFGVERIKPSDLKIGDNLNGRVICYNEVVEERIDLYDLVEVDDGNVYYASNILQHNCDFLGSIGTLINPAKLKALVYEEPILSSGGLDVYENPIPDHDYLMTVDVARGMELDHSAFILVDISEYPHKIVGKYRSNTIKPMLFPDIIHKTAKKYNDAWTLIEINDIGDQVASILYYDLEYSNVLMTSMRGRAGQVLGGGFSGGKTQLGLKMARAPKKLGCSNLKQLIESDKIIFTDFNIITELTTFIEKRGGFEAEEGCHDDLVSCLILYAWCVAQTYFKELTDNDVRKQLYEFDKESLEEDMAPFGFLNTGLEEEIEIGEDGLVWNKADEIDEYGTTMSPWEFVGQSESSNFASDPSWWTI